MKLATITPVFNESDILPHFLDYYSSQVDSIFILDNESTDDSREIADLCDLVDLREFKTGGKLNDRIQHEEIMRIRKECVGKYDYVLLPDCDEFIVPKVGGSIREVLSRLPDADVHGTQGYNMFPGPLEAPYDRGKSLFRQRKHGRYEKAYSKPIIVKPESKVEYGYGRHGVLNVRAIELDDPSLAAFFLLHYVGVDEEIWVRRRLQGRIKRISQENIDRGLGVAYWSGGVLDEKSLRDQFRKFSDPQGGALVKIVPEGSHFGFEMPGSHSPLNPADS